MILRNDPGATIGAANNQGALAAPVATLTDFCRDCHDGTALAQPSYRAANNTTCSGGCHSAQMLVTNIGSRYGVSHIMTTTLTGTSIDASGEPRQGCEHRFDQLPQLPQGRGGVSRRQQLPPSYVRR
jgi:hypothetical protein